MWFPGAEAYRKSITGCGPIGVLRVVTVLPCLWLCVSDQLKCVESSVAVVVVVVGVVVMTTGMRWPHHGPPTDGGGGGAVVSVVCEHPA